MCGSAVVAKAVTGTMVKAIHAYQETLDEPDGGRDNYARFAYHVNHYTEIFNGTLCCTSNRGHQPTCAVRHHNSGLGYPSS